MIAIGLEYGPGRSLRLILVASFLIQAMICFSGSKETEKTYDIYFYPAEGFSLYPCLNI